MAILLNNVIPSPLSNAQNFTNLDNKLTMKEIECHSEEYFDFHIHTKLIIMIDNQLYPIPANIGIIPEKCIYWLHTHDNSGLIHIESPIKKTLLWDNYYRYGSYLIIQILFTILLIIKLMEILVYMLTIIIVILQLSPIIAI